MRVSLTELHRYSQPSYVMFPVKNCRYALAFVVVPIHSKELEDFVNDWNSHGIRPVMGAVSPSGIPDDLYQMPNLQGWLLNWRATTVYYYSKLLFRYTKLCQEADHELIILHLSCFFGCASQSDSTYNANHKKLSWTLNYTLTSSSLIYSTPIFRTLGFFFTTRLQ